MATSIYPPAGSSSVATMGEDRLAWKFPTANTSAGVQAAINAAVGGVAYLPPATYALTQTGTIGGIGYCVRVPSNVSIRGAGIGSRLAYSGSASAAVATLLYSDSGSSFTGPVIYSDLRNLNFQPIAKRTAGWEIYAPNVSACENSDLRFLWCNDILKLGNSAGPLTGVFNMTNVMAFNCNRVGRVENHVDAKWQNWEFNSAVGTFGPVETYGVANADLLVLSGHIEANTFFQCEFINGANIDGPDANTATTGASIRLVADGTGSPSFNVFCDCLADSSANGVVSEAGEGNKYIGSWGSNRGAGTGVGTGFVFGAASRANIVTATEVTNCKGFGIVDAGTDNSFTDILCQGASATSGSGVIRIASGASRSVIRGGRLSKSSRFALPQYSVKVDSGATGTRIIDFGQGGVAITDAGTGTFTRDNY